jgi:putative membrane protein
MMSGSMWMPTLPPDVARLFAVHLQPIPVLPILGIVLLLAYALGVLVLRHRRDRWPVGRTICWAIGVLVILVITSTGVDGYGMELFSVHMAQHMALSMLAPLFLVLGAPITLLLRALPSASLPRRALLGVLHSRAARLLTNPLVTVSLFLISLYGLYFTPLFDLLMATMWGHNLMLIHFLLLGFLYFWGVVAVDPSPRRLRTTPPVISRGAVRIIELLSTVPFHAFFGVVIMMSVSLVVRFYSAPVPGWGISPLADQRVGGGIAWGFTEIPTLVVLGVLFAQWQRSEARLERRLERTIARTDDAERTDYNAYLARLAAHDRAEHP